MTIIEIIVAALVIVATLLVVATALLQLRAFPILVVAKLIWSWSTTGFDLNDFIRAIIAIAGVWIVGSVGSFIMGRTLYGVTVSDKRDRHPNRPNYRI